MQSRMVSCLRHVDGFGGIVERPLETVWRWIRFDFTKNFRIFVACNAINAFLFGAANWLVCKMLRV